jgi:hypothetical protein
MQAEQREQKQRQLHSSISSSSNDSSALAAEASEVTTVTSFVYRTCLHAVISCRWCTLFTSIARFPTRAIIAIVILVSCSVEA